jgi:hypothetical protein
VVADLARDDRRILAVLRRDDDRIGCDEVDAELLGLERAVGQCRVLALGVEERVEHVAEQ